MVMRARAAFRLFFEARTKKFQATGWKDFHSVDIHGTGAFGRRSITPSHTLPPAFRLEGCGPKEKGPGPGWSRAWPTSLRNELSPGNLRFPGLWFCGEVMPWLALHRFLARYPDLNGELMQAHRKEQAEAEYHQCHVQAGGEGKVHRHRRAHDPGYPF